MDEQYMLLSLKHSKGDYWVWWGPKSNGYVSDMERAGRYSKEEALRISSGHPNSVMPVREALAFSFGPSMVQVMRHVDFEVMSAEARALTAGKGGG